VQRYVKDKVRCRLLDRVRVVGKKLATGLFVPGRNLSADQDAAWDLHDDGVRLYYARSFREAAVRFREVRKLLHDDAVATMFLERCERAIATTPGDDWDGVENISEK
jgi:hypothetical protein